MNTNKKSLTTLLVQNAIIASLYLVFSIILAPFSFGPFQIRISEILTLLPFVNPGLSVGVVLGCFFTNMFSPFGILDVIVGTTCTAITVFLVSKSKNLLVATIYPTLLTIPVAYVVSFFEAEVFIFIAISIGLSEFITVTLIGYPLLKGLLKNKFFVKTISRSY